MDNCTNPASSAHKPACDWLYPDLLTATDLRSILKERYVKDTNLDVLDKPALLELYSKYVIPLPQRKYRLNRRGSQMTKKQIQMAKKRRLYSDSSVEQPAEKRRSTGKNMSFDIQGSGGDRLKPPPNCVDFKKKTIKLNSKTNNHTTEKVSSSLTKLKVTDSRSSPKRKLVSCGGETSHATSPPVSTGSTSLMEVDPSNAESPAQTTPKSSKIKKISWP